MHCVICKTGATKAGNTNNMLDWDDKFIIKHIPAQICSQCGEAHFDSATVKIVMAKANEAFDSGAELEVVSLKAG